MYHLDRLIIHFQNILTSSLNVLFFCQYFAIDVFTCVYSLFKFLCYVLDSFVIFLAFILSVMFHSFVNFSLHYLSLLSASYSGSCYSFSIVVFLVGPCITLKTLQPSFPFYFYYFSTLLIIPFFIYFILFFSYYILC